MVGHGDEPRGGKGEGQGRSRAEGAVPERMAPERIAKLLARAGVASRRAAERLISEGRVAVNGRVLATPAVTIGPGDVVTLDGAPVAAAEPSRLFLYHKPPGLLTTHADPKGRPTVFDALPAGLPRLISVGRLDLSSEGLLLLTNDGELARRLELPATGLVRRYRARALGRIDQQRLDRLRQGSVVAGVRYGPITASLEPRGRNPEAANQWIALELAEGKNREVRRVLEALGLRVNRLIRTGYGPFALGDLPRGEVRELGARRWRAALAPVLRGSGSGPAEPPPSAPRAPMRSASLPKSSRARRRGPPRGGGPGRRG